MQERKALPPEKRRVRNYLVAILYAVVLSTQAIVLTIALSAMTESARTGFAVKAGTIIGACDLLILAVGLSLRRHFLSSRDVVASFGAEQALALLELVGTESRALAFIAEKLGSRLTEMGLGDEVREGEAILADINASAAETRGLYASTRGRRDEFFDSIADDVERFSKAIPRLQAILKSLVDSTGSVFNDYDANARSLRGYLFLLTEARGILSDMSSESNRYAAARMGDILGGFRDLEGYSKSISEDISGAMRGMISGGGRTSLGSIASESGAIAAELDAFFADMDALRGFTEEIARTNAGQLANIRKMAEGIEGFAETIRLISMNVNVQAARLSSSAAMAGARDAGRGFQVLARNLSDFAVKAQELAKAEGLTIDAADKALTGVNRRFIERLEASIGRVPAIRSRLDPFEGIIRTAFGDIERMMGVMGGLSAAVQVRLKAIIGQLQFQDLTRQELEHIVSFLSECLSLRGSYGADSAAAHSLLKEEEADLRAIAVRIFSRLATTVNEKRVIDAYVREHSVAPVDRGEDSGLSDGAIRMF